MKTPCPRTLRLTLVAALLPLAAHAQTIFIDFGGGGQTTTVAGWNNVTNVSAMASAASLFDINSQVASGITYQITDGFYATNGQGASTAVGEFPLSATRDSFYGDNTNAPTASITFAGFDPSKQYTFTFFASRAATSEDRSALYSLTGEATSSAALNPSSNETNTVSITAITPNENGLLILDISKHPTLNVSSSGFFYLNAMKIEVAQVPEPSSAAALAGAAALTLIGLRRRRRSA